MPFEPRCLCCECCEPPDGWYLIGGGGPVETWEFFCSKGCFVAHEDRECGCFADDDLYEDEMEDVY